MNSETSQTDLRNWIEDIGKDARKNGIDLELRSKQTQSISVLHTNRCVENTSVQARNLLKINVYKNGYMCSTFTENATHAALHDVAHEAMDLLQWLIRSTERPGIPALMYEAHAHSTRDLNLGTENVPSLVDMIEAARIQEAACLDSSIGVHAVVYNRVLYEYVSRSVFNSSGINISETSQMYHSSCYPMIRDQSENVMCGISRSARSLEKLNPMRVAREASQKVSDHLGSQFMKTGEIAAVFSDEVMASFLQLIATPFSARTVYNGQSFFKDKLGTPAASSVLTLSDEPWNSEGEGAQSFDDEGAPTASTVLIHCGEFQNYLTDWSSSQHLKWPHTSNASEGVIYFARDHGGIMPSNLVLRGNPGLSCDALLQGQRVLYVTDVTGLHSGYNSMTGAFSFPARGVLYENGVRHSAVRDFLISGTMPELLTDVEAVGSQSEFFLEGVLAAPVRIKKIQVSGQ